MQHTIVELTRVQRQLSNQLAADLKPLGLTLNTWITLDALSQEPGLPVTNIAKALCLNLPTVTKLIDRMVSKNMVYRKPHPKDRRLVLIFPTERGLILHKEALDLVSAISCPKLSKSLQEMLPAE